MLHEIGLVLAVGVSGAVAVDLLGSRPRRRAMAPYGLMAAAVSLWAAGELLLLGADTPGEVIAARRILFLGPCFFSPLWLWAAWSASGRPLAGAVRVVVIAALALGGLFWSTLWWERSGLFFAWYARPPERGPLFLVHGVLAWAMIVAGLVVWLRFAVRASAAGPWQRGVAAGAAVLPLLANGVYLLGDVPASDPTPLVLAAAVLAFRAVVLGGTFAPYFVSFARAELLDQIDAGLLVADVTGRVVEANAAARRLTGTSRPVGEPLEALLARARHRAGTGLAWREFPLRRRATFAGRGAVLLDRSEERDRERDREVGHRLQGLGFLAAGVAHEINNPLTYVMADVESLEEILAALADPAPPDPAAWQRRAARTQEGLELVDECRDGLRRIEQTVAFLSGLATRQHRSAPRTVTLREPVAQAVDMARLGQGGRIHVVQRGHLPPVRAVPEDVVQIVLQLLANALEVDPEGAVEVRMAPWRNGVRVEVLDGGPGIPEAELAHVFDPYFTTKAPEGQGLGLAFAHELARRHGGGLSAANRPGGGACFSLWLPAAEEGEADGEGPCPGAEGP